MSAGRVVAAIAVAWLGSGCSVLFGPDLSEGCTGDSDRDGYLALGCGGDDCADNDPSIHPGATEVCDPADIDEDCDPTTLGEDADGDGQYSIECANQGIRRLSGGSIVDEVVLGTDCDDGNPDVYLGAPEICDFEDNDCDGEFDEGLPELPFGPDCDGDGFGDDFAFVELACQAPREAPMCAEGLEGTWLERLGDCDDTDPARQTSCGACADVDLLIVMDTGEGMMAEQAELAAQLAAIPRVLGTGDVDGDGVVDFQPIESLHVAVVTSDLGVAPFDGDDIPGCTAGGDDGVLVRDSPRMLCAPRRSRLEDGYLRYEVGQTVDLDEFLLDWACLVVAGTDGCRVEQPLEAALKALTPAASPIRFPPDDDLGHGDGLNRGFLRDDSLLVVLYVTNQDDCSIEDRELLRPSGGPYDGTPPGARCAVHDDALQPLSRYVSGLLERRATSDLVVGIVAGVPEAFIPDDGIGAPYEAILASPAMQIDTTTTPGEIQPSCTRGAGGPIGAISAEPPRRLVRYAQDLEDRGVRTVLSSICANRSYPSMVAATIRAARDAATERCGVPD